jgi:hypothetical protein
MFRRGLDDPGEVDGSHRGVGIFDEHGTQIVRDVAKRRTVLIEEVAEGIGDVVAAHVTQVIGRRGDLGTDGGRDDGGAR